jgi:drug/metabolite transporter superfamily protein YnfA
VVARAPGEGVQLYGVREHSAQGRVWGGYDCGRAAAAFSGIFKELKVLWAWPTDSRCSRRTRCECREACQ